MGMTKQDLARRLRSMKAISYDPPTPEVLPVLSDVEETLSRPSLKRRRPVGISRTPSEDAVTASVKLEHTLSSKGTMLVEGSSNVCHSF